MSGDADAQRTLDEYAEQNRQTEEKLRREAEKRGGSRRILSDSKKEFLKEQRRRRGHKTVDVLWQDMLDEQARTKRWIKPATKEQVAEWVAAQEKPQVKKRRKITQEQDRLIRREIRKNPKVRVKDIIAELEKHKWKRGQPEKKAVTRRIRKYKRHKAAKRKKKQRTKKRRERKRKKHDDWVRKQKGLKPRKHIPKLPPITGKFTAAFICEYVDPKTRTRMISPHEFIVKHRGNRSKLWEAWRFHRIHFPRHTVLERPEIGEIMP